MAVRPPVLSAPPAEYDVGFFTRTLAELRQYFERANAPVPVNAATLNININTLPTQVSLATLASGDVYRDTTAGNVLKVKP
jgi:hypothetical protein